MLRFVMDVIFTAVIARNEETEQSRFEWFILSKNIPFATGSKAGWRLLRFARNDSNADILIEEYYTSTQKQTK